MPGGLLTQYMKVWALGGASSCVQKALQGGRKRKKKTQIQLRGNSMKANAAAQCLLEQFVLPLS